MFSQDQPLTSYNYCTDYNNLSSPWGYDYGNNNIPWDQDQYKQFVNSSYSSPEGNICCSMKLQYNDVSGDAPPAAMVGSGGGGGGGRRKRRRRISKNKEEVEQQRMTHIAVERNRRKQMNDYLAVIRSLMPPSYSQRVCMLLPSHIYITFLFHLIFISFVCSLSISSISLKYKT